VLELFVLGILVLVGIAIFGAFWAVASLVCWVLFLPFKLLGLMFRGLAVLLALPLLVLAGILGAMLFGAGLIAFLVPALPLVLLVLAIVWLARRRPPSVATPTT
jgi:hypothetical protein